ncbi:MAG: HAD-IIIA family hydrolase [Candidatus Omnitrophica bacterium]|nr:HAD-IIIA family hydrolase [Candidatus Omnitrophota bacterium]MBU1127832.1 HAD-IIIA family hydrolase [Candidatus Omnitrophota bacterium]MBU1657302.1 HAD-IIIA family hydrolase [Candidatus Omnitrophota bacterium]MBU1851171.1 HAD-IIIA family hydrolase [Candidatus Omnitrophota bacterium]
MLNKYSEEIIEKAKKIKLLILDVDGVLTDGQMIYGSYGDELKNFNVNDGLGLYMMRKAGFKNVILTAKASRVVTKRAKTLRVDKVYHNFHYKIKAYCDIKRRFKVDDDEICFIGDDLIDIPVLKRVGLAACPPNAVGEAKCFAHFITEKSGGRGAVREVCNLLLRASGLWDEVTAGYFE